MTDEINQSIPGESAEESGEDAAVEVSIHDTPMLDELENGPWPSFISGIKKLRNDHEDERVNGVANDLLGQLEHSYETRKGYWKGGTVSVYGYGSGIIPRFSEVGDQFPKSRSSTRFGCSRRPATITRPIFCVSWPTVGKNGVPDW